MPVTQSCPYLRILYKYIGYNRPHPLYCPQFLQYQHKIGQISCPVEGGARILEVRNLEVRLYVCMYVCQGLRCMSICLAGFMLMLYVCLSSRVCIVCLSVSITYGSCCMPVSLARFMLMLYGCLAWFML